MKVLENNQDFGKTSADSRIDCKFPGLLQKGYQIISNEPFITRDEGRRTIGKLPRAVGGGLLVGTKLNVAVGMLNVFQKGTIELLIEMIADLSRRGERRANNETDGFCEVPIRNRTVCVQCWNTMLQEKILFKRVKVL